MQIRRYGYEGFEVPVEIRGSSTETLVFLTGLGVHPAYYAEGLDALSRRFRVFAPDLSFRRRRELPESTEQYLGLVRGMARDLAPDAVWSGHSFGALLALLSERPAIACAPSVPAETGILRMFGRAVHQQLREYAGLEGWRGVTFAARIMVDYVSTALLRPRALFPPVASLRAPPGTFPPRVPRAVVYLCERDELYREREYRAYFHAADAYIEEIRVGECHDWPILEPERLCERVEAAYERLGGGASSTAVG